MQRVVLGERGRAGESHPRARLSDAIVADMRTAADNGATHAEVARRFGVAFWTARRVLRYQQRVSLARRVVDLDALRARYKAGGVTQRELAEEVRVSLWTMNRWLNA